MRLASLSRTVLATAFFAGALGVGAVVTPDAQAQEANAGPPPPRYLPAWAIRTAAESALDDVHACYVKHVPAADRVGNGDNGRAQFVFAPAGNVESVVWADTTVAQESARNCMLDALRKITAPIASERRTEVIVWFGLSSQRDDTTATVKNDPNQRLSSKRVVEIVNEKIDAFMLCYTSRLESRPDLAGRVKFIMAVSPSGKVASVKVVESLDPQVDACVVRTAQALMFPAPGDAGVVIATIPITFKSK
jgi:TonB family protein